MSTKPSLPSLNVLFKESWATFKGSALNLFILSIIGTVIFIALFIVGAIAALPFGIFSIYNAVTTQKFDAAFFSSLGAVALIFAIVIIASVIVSYAIQAANILIVGNKGKVEIGAVLKKGFSYVLPLFLAGIVMGFIVAGGYFLFIIPGIFFALLFSFTFFEIVLNKQGVLSALRRSSRIVLSNFWGIFGRFLLWFVIAFAILFIPQMIVSSARSSALSGIWMLVQTVLNVLIGWYGLCYMITLYKQASKGLESDKGSKLLWPLITAIVGWIVGILFIFAIIALIGTIFSNLAQQQSSKKSNMMQEDMMLTPEQVEINNAVKNAMENPTETNMREILKLIPTSSPEYVEFEKQIEQSFPSN